MQGLGCSRRYSSSREVIIRNTSELVNIHNEWIPRRLCEGTRWNASIALQMVVDIDCVGCMEGDEWVTVIGYYKWAMFSGQITIYVVYKEQEDANW